MASIVKSALKDGSPRYKAIVRRKGAPMKTKTLRTRATVVLGQHRDRVGTGVSRSRVVLALSLADGLRWPLT